MGRDVLTFELRSLMQWENGEWNSSTIFIVLSLRLPAFNQVAFGYTDYDFHGLFSDSMGLSHGRGSGQCRDNFHVGRESCLTGFTCPVRSVVLSSSLVWEWHGTRMYCLISLKKTG